ncbi:radical SAM protein [Candidatus Woesearchaeota archaeon]|nr:radical SAM protein [Candidatus Woesearchaeota archaeon]
MKVLFISAPAMSIIGKKSLHEKPLEVGLSRIPFEIFSYLDNRDNKLKKRIVDLEWELDKYPDKSYKQIIADEIRNFSPNIVLTSLYAQSLCSTIDQITTTVKEENEKIITIVGGQAIDHLQSYLLKLIPNTDIICDDPELLAKIIKSPLVHKRKIYLNQKRKSKTLNYIPAKSYNLFPIDDFIQFYNMRGVTVFGYLQNQAGCTFQCNFCAVPRIVQERDISATISEAEYLLKRGINNFYLTDLTFGLNKKKSIQLLKAFKDLRKKYQQFKFRIITRVDIIDEEFISALKNAGCYEIGFGIESNSTEILDKINKKTTTKQNLDAIILTSKYELPVRLFIMLGLEGENSNDLFHFLYEANDINQQLLIQPSLKRDIIGDKLIQKIDLGHLARGNLHQLDFRIDGRKYGLNTTQDIVNYLLLILGWPSTEFYRNGNNGLQEEILSRDIKIYNNNDLLIEGGITRREDIILLDAKNQRYLYVPTDNAVKIGQCIMQSSNDFFDFLVLANGKYNLTKITNEITQKHNGERFYETLETAKKRIQEIYSSLLESQFISPNPDS